MKNWLFLFLLLLATSCTDEEQINGGSGDSIQLNLYVPTSTTVSTRAMSEEEESAIKDLYVLVFDEKDNCILVKKTEVSDTEDNTKKKASLILDKSNESRSIVALANLEANNVTKSPDSWMGEKKTTILKSLTYTFRGSYEGTGTSLVWKPFPMWGEFKGMVSSSITINMLRALAKVNVIVNEDKDTGAGLGLENFILNEISLCYSYADGYCVPDESVVAGTGESTKVIKPSIYTYTQSGIENLMKFTVPESERLAFKNNIYLPEADNHKDGQKNVCLLIGGYYDGGNKMSYYRASFQNSEERVLDILRNHLYKFNIKSVTGPGSENPEEALKKVDVNMTLEVTEWDEVTMRDPNVVQYDLAVDKSAIIFSGQNLEGTITVLKPDAWDIVPPKDGWFEAIKNTDGTITIKIKEENTGAKRFDTFIVKSAQLEKVIKITQIGVETANCYIVDSDYDATRDLVVNIKGNGKDGLVSDGKNGQHKFEDQDESLKPAAFGIIWETVEGLVSITEPVMNKFGCIQYKVNKDKVGKGGNALIGAYDKDNNILWSWHIWIITEAEKIEEHKWVTGYTIMDRSLGAISTKPGYGSLGLLYQWGRKDPLVGVGNIKAATRDNMFMHTNPKDNKQFAWEKATSNTIAESILYPTRILPDGLCIDTNVDGQFLWGTNRGLDKTSVGVTNVGNKTIYDPCPAGYRVPPVDAYVFESRSSDSYKANWNYNNVFWPNKNEYFDGASAYGFWLKYGVSDGRPNVIQYTSDYYTPCPESVKDATWFPISGVYAGSFDFAVVGENSSVKVNSIVWTNSPISTTTETRPAALFLHGREKVSSTGMGGASSNGRHLHKLNETQYGLMAKTQYAGSVRCVRDKVKDYSSQNSVTAKITLGGKKEDSQTGTLTTVNNRWEVVDPGAKWFYVTPEEGVGGIDQKLTFIASMDNTTGKSLTATMKIRFYDENGNAITPDKEIRVTQSK